MGVYEEEIEYMTRIKMIVTDLDDTFLTGGNIIPINIQACRDAMAAGIIVCVCTGRAWTMATRIIPQMLDYISPYVVTSNGAALYDARTHEAIANNYIPKESFLRLIYAAKEHKLPHNVFCGSELVCYRELKPWWFDNGIARNATLTDPSQKTNFVVMDDWDEYARYTQDKAELFRVPAIVDEGPIPEPLGKLIEELGGLEISTSYIPHWDVVSMEATKKNGVRQLSDILGISRENIMTVGDSTNDTSMIKWAGLGVAVGNALPAVKEAADHVVASCLEGGFAEAVYRFALRDAPSSASRS